MVPDRAAAEGDAGGPCQRRGPRAQAGRRAYSSATSPRTSERLAVNPKALERDSGLSMAPIDPRSSISWLRAPSRAAGPRRRPRRRWRRTDHRAAAGLGQCAPFRMEEVSRYDERARPGIEQQASVTPARISTRRSIDFRQGPAEQRGRHDRRAEVHRAGLRDRLLEGMRRRSGLRADDPVHEQWKGHGRIAGKLGAASHRLVEAQLSRLCRAARLCVYAGAGAAVVNGLSKSATCTASAPRRSAPISARAITSIRCTRPISHARQGSSLQCLTNLDLLPPKGAVIRRAAQDQAGPAARCESWRWSQARREGASDEPRAVHRIVRVAAGERRKLAIVATQLVADL